MPKLPRRQAVLPSRERRRATPSTRIALTTAQQALTHAGLDAKAVPAVFGSSSGNPDIIHDICAMLAAGDYLISPTKLHNSVHNAASGYYSIAVASHRAVTSLCAFDGTATAALLETAVQAIAADSVRCVLRPPYRFRVDAAHGRCMGASRWCSPRRFKTALRG